MRSSCLLALPFLAGCLEIGKTTYRFDLATGEGTLVLGDIRTDTPTDAAKDFGELVNSYVLGNKVSEDHPSWNVGDRRLYEDAGTLAGEVKFRFGRPSDVGLYQYDKKSPFLWCAADTETVIRTTGEIVAPYPKCVVFDRKTKVFEITVQTGTPGNDGQSLLPEFKTWDGSEVASTGDSAMEGMKGLLGALSGLAGEGGEGQPDLGAMLSGLSGILPATEPGEAWKALNLPLDGGTVVLSTDQMLEISYAQTEPAAQVGAFEKALAAAGWKRTGEEAGAVAFEKAGASLRLSAVKAGETVLVVLSH